MNAHDLIMLDGITLEKGEPVFNEPWEAQAFAMTIALHKQNIFSWQEWADALSREIHGGKQRSYYQHWLAALEILISEKGLTSTAAINQREQAWHDAAARTPHGEPIEL